MSTRLKNAFVNKTNSIGLPILALCCVCFFWGTTWIASKQGVSHMPALQLVAIRQLLGGIFYVIYFLYKKAVWPKGKQWRTILILSLLNFVLSNGLSTWGVKYISSGLGAIIGAMVPVWIVLISFFKGERIKSLSLVGIITSFIGVCLVFYEHLSDFLRLDFKLGIFLSVTATITWAFGTLYFKKNAADFNPYFSVGLQMLISSLCIFIFTGVSGTNIPITQIPVVSWWAIAYLVIIGSVFTFVAFIYALQHLPTVLSSLYSYINPIVAVLLGAFFFDEKLTFAIAIGGAVTISGLYIINYSLRKKNYN